MSEQSTCQGNANVRTTSPPLDHGGWAPQLRTSSQTWVRPCWARPGSSKASSRHHAHSQKSESQGQGGPHAGSHRQGAWQCMGSLLGDLQSAGTGVLKSRGCEFLQVQGVLKSSGGSKLQVRGVLKSRGGRNCRFEGC